jgi:hypothetical protein
MKRALATLLSLAVMAVPATAHVDGCRTKACDRRIHEKRRAHWKGRHIWEYRWHHLRAADRAWARCIAHWETFGIPWGRKATVVGTGGHLGAMQFDPGTAVSAGFTRTVTRTTLHEQLVRAVWWRNRTSPSQWSTSYHCR